MSLFEEAINELDNFSDRDPREFPYGFYLIDDWAGGSGSFTWYKTEKNMVDSLKRILLGFLSQDEDRKIKDVKSRLSGLIKSVTVENIVGNELQVKIVAFLNGEDSPIRCDYIGTFSGLCNDSDEWVCDVRDSFRWAVLDGAESLSVEEMKSPIKKDEINGFVEYLSSYGV